LLGGNAGRLPWKARAACPKRPAQSFADLKARLYPTAKQADRLNQWAGSLRSLWNRLLEAEQAEYAISKNSSPRPNCDAVPSL
jgi:hypothetical protein